MNANGIFYFFNRSIAYAKAFIGGGIVGGLQSIHEANYHKNTENAKIIQYLLEHNTQDHNHVISIIKHYDNAKKQKLYNLLNSLDDNDNFVKLKIDMCDDQDDVFYEFAPEFVQFPYQLNFLINTVKNGSISVISSIFHNNVVQKLTDVMSNTFNLNTNASSCTMLFGGILGVVTSATLNKHYQAYTSLSVDEKYVSDFCAGMIASAIGINITNTSKLNIDDLTHEDIAMTCNISFEELFLNETKW